MVGKVVSPYYLTFQREPSDIGSGRVNLFMMVSEDEFLYPVYTEALVTVAGARELDSYSQEYSRLVQAVTNRLDNLGTERAALRLESLKAQAQQELDSAKASWPRGRQSTTSRSVTVKHSCWLLATSWRRAEPRSIKAGPIWPPRWPPTSR